MQIQDYHMDRVFDAQGRFQLDIPAGARVLHVGVRRGKPTIFALVDPEAEPESRPFLLATERTDLPSGLRYCGSFTIGTGFTGHVFEGRGRS